MQTGFVSKLEKERFRQTHSSTRCSFKDRCLSFLFPGLVIFVFCLASLVACGAVSGSKSSSWARTHSPKSISLAAFAVSLLSTPTDTSLGPTASPTVTFPAPPPATPLPPEQVVQNFVQRYMSLVLDGQLQKAYNLLSEDLQTGEPFSDYQSDPNYILSTGPDCWNIGEISVSQLDDQTWDVWVPVTQVSCVDGTTIQAFWWHFYVVVLPGGLPEIAFAELVQDTTNS